MFDCVIMTRARQGKLMRITNITNIILLIHINDSVYTIEYKHLEYKHQYAYIKYYFSQHIIVEIITPLQR